MAGIDPQKQLLTLIRDFATEKSLGERRVVGLKKRIEELRSGLESANAELEEAKHCRECNEQEVKGYEVQLALNEAAIQALEARISLIHNEISIVGSDLEVVKNEEEVSRHEFISQMFELNAKIRKFQETVTSHFHEEDRNGRVAEVEDKLARTRNLEDLLAHIISQTTKEEETFQAEQNIQKQVRSLSSVHSKVQQKLIDFERKVSLMEGIMKETKEIQDLTRQTSGLEEMCASFGEDVQKKCVCPSCHLDNAEALGEIFQANMAN